MSNNVFFPEIDPVLQSEYAQESSNVSPDNILSAGNLPGSTVIRIGSPANIIIDGKNKNVRVNDGTNDRVLIGKF